MAGSVIVTLPVLFIFIYFEKYLVYSGLTAGDSVKDPITYRIIFRNY